MSNREIETTATEIVYKNRWMTVREDKIIRADGSSGIYGVVEKPNFAVIAAVHNHQIYLVEQYRYTFENRYWELPQGSWEQNTDPLKLAKAELQEETGIIAGSMHHAGHLFLAYGFSTQEYDVFLATELTHGPTQLDAEEQGLIAKAFDICEVEKMITEGIIKDATTVATFGLLRLKGLL